MQPFVTIYTFSYPHQAAIIQGRLESEGIETFLKDELTVQTYHFYSNAIGGIKLQVRENDVPDALEILKDAGYVVEEEEAQLPKFWQKIDKFFIGFENINPKRLWRSALKLAIGVATLAGVIYYLTKPSIEEVLTANMWCVTHIVYQGKEYYPKTVDMIMLSSDYYCTEFMSFKTNGRITLPGFGDRMLTGDWHIGADDSISITSISSFENVFLRKFEVEWDEPYLTLYSDSTIIYGYKEKIY